MFLRSTVMRPSSHKLILGIVVAAFAALSGVPVGSTATWELGDLFVSVTNGGYQLRDKTGASKDSLTDPNGGVSRGCALNSSLSLYTVNASNNAVTKYLF